jgi:hypothetical protein
MESRRRTLHLLRQCVPVLATTIFLFSCAAKKPVTQITVEVPANYSGELRITPCRVGSALDHLMADSNGRAETSTCLQGADRVSITVIQSGKISSIPPSEVQLAHTGDGLVVEIRARLPK